MSCGDFVFEEEAHGRITGTSSKGLPGLAQPGQECLRRKPGARAGGKLGSVPLTALRSKRAISRTLASVLPAGEMTMEQPSRWAFGGADGATARAAEPPEQQNQDLAVLKQLEKTPLGERSASSFRSFRLS